jgi:hypothetical protein
LRRPRLYGQTMTLRMLVATANTGDAKFCFLVAFIVCIVGFLMGLWQGRDPKYGWAYGALAIVVLAIIALGLYFTIN